MGQRRAPVDVPPLQAEGPVVSDSRRRNMAAIRGKNTLPEHHIRQLLFGLGYRFRIHVTCYLGNAGYSIYETKEDYSGTRLFLGTATKVAQRRATQGLRTEFWERKFEATVRRDELDLAALESDGWKVLLIWECELRRAELGDVLRGFLGSPRSELLNDVV